MWYRCIYPQHPVNTKHKAAPLDTRLCVSRRIEGISLLCGMPTRHWKGMVVRMSTKVKSARYILLLGFLDLLCSAAAVIIGFRLKFGFVGMIPTHYTENINFYILALFVFTALSNTMFRVYSPMRRNIDVAHISLLLPSTVTVFAALVLADRTLRLGMPVEVMGIICALLLCLMLLARMVVKGLRAANIWYESAWSSKGAKRVIIYAAGEMGKYLYAKLLANPYSGRRVVAFIDDDRALHGKRIGTARVVGGFRSLVYAIRTHAANEVIIALPGADTELVKRIVSVCRQYKVEVSRFGTIENIDTPEQANISGIRLEDLLRRDRINLNMKVVRAFLQGRTVFVTGGAGSIGSEICRQALSFGAARVVVFDIDENGLFDIGNELRTLLEEDRFFLRIGSIRDTARLSQLFAEFKPDVVFHAAAHKHVPMMEDNPAEAIKNNVFGTLAVARTAARYRCGRFILISTDKAVNPPNIMGASKRIAERCIQMLNAKSGKTVFAAVRFGNVLGSSGSVVPFFIKQIESGGPVTVTHPDMRRYFMTIPEAVQLVLEAGGIAAGGEIFVLDMGEPVRIYDLACDLIMLHGLKPNTDIKIEFCGLRPGEKLFEEIRLAEEDVSKTDNNKIFVLKQTENDFTEFSRAITELEQSCRAGDTAALFESVRHIVPSFMKGKDVHEEGLSSAGKSSAD